MPAKTDPARSGIIPLELRAMPVSATSRKRYANIGINYVMMQDQRQLAKSIESAPLADREGEKRGVHLHWILPEFLRSGAVDEGGGVLYPAVPNRWLVTRLWNRDGGQRGEIASRRFLVESDALLPEKSAAGHNDDSQSHPFPDDPTRPYRFLGRSAPYGTALPPPPARLAPLCAVAPGSPYFAAYAPLCRNVFGFIDALDDAPPGELSYSVCGWYSPLPKGTARIVCHGMVCGIPFMTEGSSEPPHFTAGGSAEVAVGNNSAEAWAALDEERSGSDHCRLRRYFLSGMLDRLSGPNAVLDAEQTLHTLMFEAGAASGRLGLKPRDKNAAKDAAAFAGALNALNAEREELRRLGERRAAHARRAYEYWCAHSFTATVPDPSLRKLLQTLEAVADGECSAAGAAEREATARRASLTAAEEALRSALPETVELAETPEDRFWLPNPPVVLFRGVERGFGFGDGLENANEGGASPGRTEEEILTALRLDSVPGACAGVTLRAESLLRLDSRGDVPAAADMLTREAALISPSLARSLAEQAFLLAGVSPTQAQREQLANSIAHLQTLPFVSVFDAGVPPGMEAAAGFTGVFPAKIAVNHFRPEWLPMLLEWQADYLPDMNVLKPEPVLENWTLGGDDFDFKGSFSDRGLTHLAGRVVVTPHAAANAAAAAERHGLRAARDAARLDILSQALGDFHDKLLMRAHYVAKPVMNPSHPELAEKVRRAAEEYISALPEVTGCFSPVRAGFMMLNTLRIIDSFGKYEEIVSPPVAIPESMRARGTSDHRHIMLPPRLLQPARVNFSWSGGAARPLQGWIVPGHADHNLALYAPDGTMLGFLQSMIGGSPAQWTPAPGTSLSPGDLPEGLRRFAARFLDFARAGVDALTPFLEGVDTALCGVNTPGNAEYVDASLFAGRPLALAEADLWLELAHPPDRYIFPEIIKASSDPHKTRNIDFLRCRFPARIGEPAHHADGVVGFFDEAFSVFHSDKIADGGEAAAFFSRDMTVRLEPRFDWPEGECPLRLQLLLDPVADVHITTGILPQKRVSLPAEATAEAMARMEYVLFVPHILADAERPSLPHPVLNGRAWRWLTAGGATAAPENCDGQALLTEREKWIQEGWLRLAPAAPAQRGDNA